MAFSSIFSPMTTGALLLEPILVGTALKRPDELRVFIAYEDKAAGKHALRVMGGLGQGLADDLKFYAEPWEFDLLVGSDWCGVAMADVIAADLIIIAKNDDELLPSAVAGWLKRAIEMKRGSLATIVTLIGPDAVSIGKAPSCILNVEIMAREAGLNFLRSSNAEVSTGF